MVNYDNVTEYYFDNLSIATTQILFCGHQPCVPKHAYGPFVRTYYLMVYIHSGKGTFKTQNTVYHLKKGCTFFIFPGEVTYYQADENDPWEYSWIAFNGGLGGYDMSQFLLRASITAQRPVHMASDSTPFDQLFNQLLTFCQDKKHFVDIKVMSLFLDIMYQYIVTENAMENLHTISTPLSSHLDLAIEYIKFYYHKNISVSEIAAYLGISREYFCNLFKKQFGTSPVKFISSYRLKNAATLLVMSNQSVAEIAYRVGFNDYNYFSNRFHSLYGISPSEYRKKFNNGEEVPDPFHQV
ncbi:MAG: AraC family transcriptional regulator [Massiliimalia sp.]|jgi:AraC-like DNA-binding protein